MIDKKGHMGVNKTIGVICIAGFLTVGCTKHNPAVCEADGDCTDPARPFCDVNGEYPESNHTPGECSTTPANCPVARCGCTPGQTLSCSNDTATVCADDGMSTTQDSCALGCSSQETRCATFTPSNGLGDALAAAANESDVSVTSGSYIDTDLGIIQDSGGSSIQVKTTLVTQPGQPSIRVFEAKSFLIDDAVVSGANAIAFVAPGTITIRGRLELGANLEQAGPGAQESPAVCVGTTAFEAACGGLLTQDSGGGGGGNATIGGTGGTNNATIAGGAPVPTFTPLVGGCRGGNVQIEGQPTVLARGGGGGGAMQLVSLTSVSITGAVDLGGGGGEGGHGVNDTSAGGGSAGLLILEAPAVSVRGPDGITANGGAAGGCGAYGSNGTTTTAQATNPSCTGPGFGGTGLLAPTSGFSCFNTGTSTCVCGGFYFAGGGAAGRIRLVTKDGAITTTQSPTISAQVTSASLVVD